MGGFGSRTRGLRVTFADSPGGSRPGSGAGWTERVAEMDSQSMRAQTPPLAGEWAVSKGNLANGSSSLVQSQGSREIKSSSFQSNGSSNMQSSQMSSSMSSSKHVSSFQSSQTSSFSSAQKSSFSFQSSSIQASKAFEAFPGMGGIENLKLEESE